jgi:hypothetical protein
MLIDLYYSRNGCRRRVKAGMPTGLIRPDVAALEGVIFDAAGSHTSVLDGKRAFAAQIVDAVLTSEFQFKKRFACTNSFERS